MGTQKKKLQVVSHPQTNMPVSSACDYHQAQVGPNYARDSLVDVREADGLLLEVVADADKVEVAGDEDESLFHVPLFVQRQHLETTDAHEAMNLMTDPKMRIWNVCVWG